MGELEFSPAAQQWVNLVLIWVGFGTLAGLLARSVLPGRQPIGTVTTLVIGIAGSTLGLLVLARLTTKLGERGTPNPISPLGMLAAVAGAFALLVAYRVLAACILIENRSDEDASEE